MAAATLELPFTARGLSGVVRVTMEANRDPVATGHDLIAPDFDAETFAGFPIVSAQVDYPARGPRAISYWLQTVSHYPSEGEESTEVDAICEPFYSVGHNPLFMDAPANPHHPDMDWLARTWLCQAPAVIAHDELHAVAGFRWGYRIEDGSPAFLLEPAAGSLADWEASREAFSRSYPDLALVPPQMLLRTSHSSG